MWVYTMGVLVLWVINPELRRLYDWRFGHSAVSIISLLPLLSVAPHLWSLTMGGGWRRLPGALAVAAWLWVGAFGYGLALAMANQGQWLSGLYAFLNFVVPAGIGLWIAADEAPFSCAYLRVTRVLFAATTFAAVYGIVQWALVPPWDADWLRGVISEGSRSYGYAVPFQIRVFSVLNSPGPFGNFMAAMLLLALPRLSPTRPLLLVQIPVWLIAFGLSLDRSGWLMFAVGTLVYLAFAPRRLTLLATLGSTAVLLAAAVAILPGLIGNDLVSTIVGDRIATLSDIGSDRSAADRSVVYTDGILEFENAPLGRGLGIVGTSTKLSVTQGTTDYDSGVLARLIELGLPGVLLLVAAAASLASACYAGATSRAAATPIDGRSVAASGLGLIVALISLELSGDVAGLLVLMLWLFAALAVRSCATAPDTRRMTLVTA
jgi:hypothetical protein